MGLVNDRPYIIVNQKKIPFGQFETEIIEYNHNGVINSVGNLLYYQSDTSFKNIPLSMNDFPCCLLLVEAYEHKSFFFDIKTLSFMAFSLSQY